MIDIFSKLLTPAKIAKINEVANRLSINPLWLMAVMYFETAKTFSTTIKNQIGSVGLIQFTKDGKGKDFKTIGRKRYLLRDIASMNFFEQMDLVYLYIKENSKGKKLNSFLDVYLTVFFPNAVGQSDSYIIQSKDLKASKIAEQNPIFDKNKDKQITKSEIGLFFSNYFGKDNYNIIKKKI